MPDSASLCGFGGLKDFEQLRRFEALEGPRAYAVVQTSAAVGALLECEAQGEPNSGFVVDKEAILGAQLDLKAWAELELASFEAPFSLAHRDPAILSSVPDQIDSRTEQSVDD
jgi:hypothetical protein